MAETVIVGRIYPDDVKMQADGPNTVSVTLFSIGGDILRGPLDADLSTAIAELTAMTVVFGDDILKGTTLLSDIVGPNETALSLTALHAHDTSSPGASRFHSANCPTQPITQLRDPFGNRTWPRVLLLSISSVLSFLPVALQLLAESQQCFSDAWASKLKDWMACSAALGFIQHCLLAWCWLFFSRHKTASPFRALCVISIVQSCGVAVGAWGVATLRGLRECDGAAVSLLRCAAAAQLTASLIFALVSGVGVAWCTLRVSKEDGYRGTVGAPKEPRSGYL